MRTSSEIRKNCKSMEGRIERLGKKLGKTRIELEAKHQGIFGKQAMFLGGDTYEWCGVYSTDTRELFLLGVLIREGQKLKNNYDK